MRIQPIDLKTSAVFLAAPVCGCFLRRECSHGIGDHCRYHNLSSRAALFENVIVDCIYSLKRFASYFRAWHTDPKCFFHAHHQLQRIDGIQTETVRAKKRKIIPNLFRVTCSIKFFTSISLMRVRRSGSPINEARFCRKLRVWSNVQNLIANLSSEKSGGAPPNANA